MKLTQCPRCDDRLTTMANTDSDDRINYTWGRCYNPRCSWDERQEALKTAEGKPE